MNDKENCVYINRNIIRKSWYKDKYAFDVFIHCLLKSVPNISFTTTTNIMANELGLSNIQVENALKKLQQYNEIKVIDDKKNLNIALNEKHKDITWRF